MRNEMSPQVRFALKTTALAAAVIAATVHFSAPGRSQSPDLAALEARLMAAMETRAGKFAEAIVKQGLSRFESQIPGLVQAAAQDGVQKMLAPYESQIKELTTKAQAIATLEQRVTALEAQLAKLAKGEKPDQHKPDQHKDDDKPKPVKAPLVVVDGGGREILRVDGGAQPSLVLSNGSTNVKLTAGATAEVRVETSGSSASLSSDAKSGSLALMTGSEETLRAGAAGDGGAQLKLGSKKNTVNLTASASETTVEVASGDKSISTSIAGTNSGFVARAAGESVAELSDVGQGYRLFVGKASGSALQAGFHKDGRIAYGMYNGGNPVARIEEDGKSSNGLLKLFKDSNEAVKLGSDGASTTALQINVGGNTMAAGFIGDENPNLFLSKGGNILATLEIGDSGDAGSLRLNGSERRLNLEAGPHTALRMYSGQDVGFYTGIDETGVTSLSLSTKGNTTAILGSSSSSPEAGSVILFNGGKPSVVAGAGLDGGAQGMQIFEDIERNQPTIDLSVTQEGPRLVIFNQDNFPQVALGINRNTNDAVLGLRDQGGKSRAILATKQGRVGLALLDAEEKPVVKLKEVDNKAGSLITFVDGKPMIALQQGAKNNPSVRVFDQGGNVRVGMGINSAGESIVSADPPNARGVFMISKSDFSGVNVYAGNEVGATMNTGDVKGEGSVSVYNGGHPVSSMTVSKNGGGKLILYDPAQSYEAFVAGSAPDGGVACVQRKGTKCLGIGLTGMEGFR